MTSFRWRDRRVRLSWKMGIKLMYEYVDLYFSGRLLFRRGVEDTMSSLFGTPNRACGDRWHTYNKNSRGSCVFHITDLCAKDLIHTIYLIQDSYSLLDRSFTVTSRLSFTYAMWYLSRRDTSPLYFPGIVPSSQPPPRSPNFSRYHQSHIGINTKRYL